MMTVIKEKPLSSPRNPEKCRKGKVKKYIAMTIVSDTENRIF